MVRKKWVTKIFLPPPPKTTSNGDYSKRVINQVNFAVSGSQKKERSKQQAQKQLGDFHLVLVNYPKLKSRACISDLADNAKTVVITH